MTTSANNHATPDNPTPVPPLNLGAQFATLKDELLAELSEVATSGYYVLGPKVTAFEEALAEYHGTKHALGVSSGTDALLVSLMALGIGPGDEVIVPTFTFFATAGCVTRVGARPVFCDIDPETFNLDPNAVTDLITPRTEAIIPVHLYGQIAEMKPLQDLAKQHSLALIEDAAQAIGARDRNGHVAGSLSTFGCLSFYPTKNLGAMGDAGAVLTNDDELFEFARKLRIHGSGHTYYHETVGGNFRIDALQAAILSRKLAHVDIWNELRRDRAARYTQLLTEAGLVPEQIRPPIVRNGQHVYHQYVLRAQRRDDLVNFLKARKIGAGVYYPLPLHRQTCFAELGHGPGDFPHAEAAAGEVVALPIYPELTVAQQETVVDAIRAFYQQ